MSSLSTAVAIFLTLFEAEFFSFLDIGCGSEVISKAVYARMHAQDYLMKVLK